MKQIIIRKWHRRLGILLSLFIILQAGSGLLISLAEFESHEAYASEENGSMTEKESELHEAMEWIHHGHGNLMNTYRVLLGVGLVAQTIIGLLILKEMRL